VTRSAPHADLEPYLRRSGYDGASLVRNYQLGTDLDGDLPVPLAAFAHLPLDAGSACIAVIAPQGDPATVVQRYRPLGAPVVFAHHCGEVQWWMQGEKPTLHEIIKAREIPRFFEVHKGELAPESIYRAKTRGVFEKAYQLDFVDTGLMPLVEHQLGEKLSALVARAAACALEVLAGEGEGKGSGWLTSKVFWLLAAKVLKDKAVPEFEKLDLRSVEPLLEQVSRHYGASENPAFALQEKKRLLALEAAAEVFAPFASLAHVTPEALAAVYENTLVPKKLRKELGIHSTPAFLTRYVVARLAPSIEDIPVESRQVFEPTCGQGSFLVAAMRLLRDLLPTGTSDEERKAYLRRSLHGLDLDPVAIELARLSLTLADIPNPDGWDLWQGDALSDSKLERIAAETTILLANPPFENLSAKKAGELGIRPGSKATAILQRIVHQLRPGAVVGVVLPQGMLQSREAADFRQELAQSFEISEVLLLPDKIFTYSDAESAVVLARKIPEGSRKPARYIRVREADTEPFRSSYLPSSERSLPQSRFHRTDFRLLFPELEELWAATQSLATLRTLALVGKGLEYKAALPAGAQTISASPLKGGHLGFARVERHLQIHGQPEEIYLSLTPELISRPRAGTAIGRGQILVSYARVSRGPWRLKAFFDPTGHAFTSRFLAVRRLSEETPLLFLWALLNSPFANAFMFAHSSKRDNLTGTLEQLPIPKATAEQKRQIEELARQYIAAASTNAQGPLFAESALSPKALLLNLDAEILRLYGLQPKLEKELLDTFAGYKRPGVPFDFDRYYPADFESYIPLRDYLSPEFHRSTIERLLAVEVPIPESILEILRIAADET